MSKKLYLGSELIATNSMLENAIDKIDSRIDEEAEVRAEKDIELQLEAEGLDTRVRALEEGAGSLVPVPEAGDEGKAVIVKNDLTYTLGDVSVDAYTRAEADDKFATKDSLTEVNDTLSRRLDSAEGDISTLQEDVSSISSNVSSLQSTVAGKQDIISDLNTIRAGAEAGAGANAYTDAGVQSAKDYAHAEDVALKEVIDNKFETNGFIVCSTDEEVNSYIINTNIGKYIKFIGTSSQVYKRGHFYQITDKLSPDNNWNTPNNTFNNNRQSYQNTGNGSTSLVDDVIGRGRIDILQTDSLTKADNNTGVWGWGNSSASDPRVSSTGNNQDQSTYIHETIGADKNLGTLTAQSQWSFLPISTIVSKNLTTDFNYRPIGTSGIILGTSINRNANVKPNDRASLDLENLPCNIRGIHKLSIADSTASCTIRLGEQLFGYIRCNSADIDSRRWNNGSIDHSIYSSLWYRYTDINDNITKTIKVSKSEIALDFLSDTSETMIIDKKLTSPSNGNNTASTDGYGYTPRKVVEFTLPLENAKSIDGVKSFEIIEVLEAYKTQDGSLYLLSRAQNAVDLLAWAAYTDFQILAISKPGAEQPYADNPKLFDGSILTNTAAVVNKFIDTARSLKGAYLASVDLDLNITNSGSTDGLIWSGLVVSSGIKQTIFTKNGTQLLVNILIDSEGEVVIKFLSSAGEEDENISIDANQTITTKKLL